MKNKEKVCVRSRSEMMKMRSRAKNKAKDDDSMEPGYDDGIWLALAWAMGDVEDLNP